MFIGALSVAAEQEMSLVEELWLHFYENYIISKQIYPNLGIDENGLVSVRLIVIGLFLGLAIAGFGAVFNKRVLGAFVRKLLSAEALSPDNAKTLDELDFAANIFVRLSLAHGYSLRRMVKCREEELYYAELAKKRAEHEEKRAQDKSLPRFKEVEYKIDVINDSFYIPEDMKYAADVKFDKKGTSLGGAVFIFIVMIVGMMAMLVALPSMLEFLDTFVGNFNT